MIIMPDNDDELTIGPGSQLDYTDSDFMISLDDITHGSGLEVQGDLIVHDGGCETVNILDTIREQRYQIEVLTDIISEMIDKKDFSNIDCNVNKRVEQKKFLHKLSKDA